MGSRSCAVKTSRGEVSGSDIRSTQNRSKIRRRRLVGLINLLPHYYWMSFGSGVSRRPPYPAHARAHVAKPGKADVNFKDRCFPWKTEHDRYGSRLPQVRGGCTAGCRVDYGTTRRGCHGRGGTVKIRFPAALAARDRAATARISYQSATRLQTATESELEPQFDANARVATGQSRDRGIMGGKERSPNSFAVGSWKVLGGPSKVLA